jgi:Ca2+-binding RTX toxin-like protein
MTLSSFGTLGQTAYEDLRFEVIKDVEDSLLVPYLDPEGIPSIGIGFNLTVHRDLVYESMGLVPHDKNDDTYISQLDTILDGTWEDGEDAELVSSMNAVMLARSNDTLYSGVRTTFAYADQEEVRGDFDVLAPGYETILDGGLEDIPESHERVALLALTWNNPLLVGAGLQAAIENNDRAEAWWEVRYNSNGGAHIYAKSRYYESQVFGLYADPENVIDDEAKSAFRMYAMHHSDMATYDGTYGDEMENANEDYELGETAYEVQDWAAASDPAVTYFAETYVAPLYQFAEDNFHEAFPNPEDAKESIDRIIVDPGAGTLHGTSATPNEVDLSADPASTDLVFGEGDDDLIIGGEGDDILFGDHGDSTLDGEHGDAGDDTLIGGNGHDMMIGGAGNDVLYADANTEDFVDFMFGDAGNDHFVVNSNGAYIFGQLDAGDVIELNGHVLTGGTWDIVGYEDVGEGPPSPVYGFLGQYGEIYSESDNGEETFLFVDLDEGGSHYFVSVTGWESGDMGIENTFP